VLLRSRAPASQAGRCSGPAGSSGWRVPAPARTTETPGDFPSPASSPSLTSPTRATTVEDSRRTGLILVARSQCGTGTLARVAGGGDQPGGGLDPHPPPPLA